MSVAVLPWASWLATILGCAVAALSAFAVHRYFSDTQAILLAPIAWMLGAFLGAPVAVYALSTIANWHSSGLTLTIIETSWLQKVFLVFLAPAAGVIGSRLGLSRRSQVSSQLLRLQKPPKANDLSPNPSLQRTLPGRSPGQRR